MATPVVFAVVAANVHADDLWNQFGHDEMHFDNNAFEAGHAYVERQRALIRPALEGGSPEAAWRAFGRLTHSVQDFYAHSNYVTLWLERFPAQALPPAEGIDPLDRGLLAGPLRQRLRRRRHLRRRPRQRVRPGPHLADRLRQPLRLLEVVIHQHMPMFHMEHCVFCAVLSPGTNRTNCGRPCDRHAVQLRDRLGMEHPLTADVGCRNTLFNATAQSGAEIVSRLARCGVRDFRVELLEESPDQTRRVLQLYQDLLAGRVSGGDVWRALRAANRVGVTRGTLEVRRHPDALL